MQNLFGYSRVLAIGDVHGMYEKLIKLMDKIRFNPDEDLLIFLGDYIDRGPDPGRCLQYIFALQQQYPDVVVCLMGNHEVMMSSYFMQKRGSYNNLIVDYAGSWLDNGGLETLKQLDEMDADTKEELLQWVMNLPVKYQYQDYFFCHAGVDPDVPLAVQNEFDMLWRRQQWWEQYKGEETLVVGHTPVQKVMKLTGKERRTPKPLFLANHVIMCDTGAYMSGGKLSCVDVLAGKVWQA
ncbi:MAG: metallophosphoesterase family protein [Succiniclasticum sp.]|jgi:serine/threonine protein phosphatase 1|nr:serine/threonine protein phosphatase [Acidaminococcaceae bacterium]MBQ2343270.1 serine/threonine protein phosphatase [Acidaminococcaceae bacterium]MEE3397516.1 metallophosphoesterase family protein [Succiniclasticum sp.]MEE3454183.1 metallophosphoesterase family protein [Succiniclasticum sp.]